MESGLRAFFKYGKSGYVKRKCRILWLKKKKEEPVWTVDSWDNGQYTR